MPYVEERTTAAGGSNMTMLLTFIVGLLIILVAVLVILHAVMHII
jgi:hypothetical protein